MLSKASLWRPASSLDLLSLSSIDFREWDSFFSSTRASSFSFSVFLRALSRVKNFPFNCSICCSEWDAEVSHLRKDEISFFSVSIAFWSWSILVSRCRTFNSLSRNNLSCVLASLLYLSSRFLAFFISSFNECNCFPQIEISVACSAIDCWCLVLRFSNKFCKWSLSFCMLHSFWWSWTDSDSRFRNSSLSPAITSWSVERKDLISLHLNWRLSRILFFSLSSRVNFELASCTDLRSSSSSPFWLWQDESSIPTEDNSLCNLRLLPFSSARSSSNFLRAAVYSTFLWATILSRWSLWRFSRCESLRRRSTSIFSESFLRNSTFNFRIVLSSSLRMSSKRKLFARQVHNSSSRFFVFRSVSSLPNRHSSAAFSASIFSLIASSNFLWSCWISSLKRLIYSFLSPYAFFALSFAEFKDDCNSSSSSFIARIFSDWISSWNLVSSAACCKERFSFAVSSSFAWSWQISCW